MIVPRYVCPACGAQVKHLLESFVHCDPVEPIDDIEDDDPTIVRGDA